MENFKSNELYAINAHLTGSMQILAAYWRVEECDATSEGNVSETTEGDC